MVGIYHSNGFSDASEFDQEATLRDLGITEDISRLERAALKAVWAQCKQIFQANQTPSHSSAPAGEVPNATSTTPSSSPPEGGWNETFPPKLSQIVVLEMKKKFQKNYPSEILSSDSLPSNRLLVLVYQTVSKCSWRWVPWKHRMTLTREEDWQLSRNAKYPKIEGLQLTSFSESHVRYVQYRSSTCDGAHLASLKSYSSKFIPISQLDMGPSQACGHLQ